MDKGAINQSKDIKLSEGPDLGWLAAFWELRGGKGIRVESLKMAPLKNFDGPLSPLYSMYSPCSLVELE